MKYEKKYIYNVVISGTIKMNNNNNDNEQLSLFDSTPMHTRIEFEFASDTFYGLTLPEEIVKDICKDVFDIDKGIAIDFNTIVNVDVKCANYYPGIPGTYKE